MTSYLKYILLIFVLLGSGNAFAQSKEKSKDDQKAKERYIKRIKKLRKKQAKLRKKMVMTQEELKLMSKQRSGGKLSASEERRNNKRIDRQYRAMQESQKLNREYAIAIQNEDVQKRMKKTRKQAEHFYDSTRRKNFFQRTAHGIGKFFRKIFPKKHRKRKKRKEKDKTPEEEKLNLNN